MYVVYCQNKPVSEFIVSEKENYFEVSHPTNLAPFIFLTALDF